MTGPAIGVHGPEREVALDMARLGLLVGPAFAALSVLFWGAGGVLSSLLATAIVVANLVGGAWIIGRAAAVSPNLLMGAVLGGFVLRLGLLTAIVLPIRGYDWFEVVPFALTLVGGHLGLLTIESQRVAAVLAASGSPASMTSVFTSTRARSESE